MEHNGVHHWVIMGPYLTLLQTYKKMWKSTNGGISANPFVGLQQGLFFLFYAMLNLTLFLKMD